jgi:hypothetical protein
MRVLGRLWTRNGFPTLGHVTTPRETLHFNIRRVNRRPDRFAVIGNGQVIANAKIITSGRQETDDLRFVVSAIVDNGELRSARGVATPQLECGAKPETVFMLMMDEVNARKLSVILETTGRR